MKCGQPNSAVNQTSNIILKKVITNVLKHQKCVLYMTNDVALSKASVGYMKRLPVYKVNAETEKLRLNKAPKT